MVGAPGHTLPLQQNYEWQLHAACKGMDTELFYHPDAERGHAKRKRIVNAKKICASCPVLNVCAEFALSNVEVYGIWGGMTERERQRITGRAIRL